MNRGTVAIVGRPNVGKSTVFNRLIGQRKSIVDDTPGVTRDRIYGEVEWLTQTFRLIDTGGIQIEDQAFSSEINMQVDIAIEEADVILFMTSAKEGVTTDELVIAKKLQKSKKPVIVVVNKADKSVEIAGSQRDAANQANEQLAVIYDGASRLDGDAREINALVDKLNGANNGIADNVSTLSAASEQISASTREATENSSKNLELISNFQILMTEISTMVSELKTYNNA